MKMTFQPKKRSRAKVHGFRSRNEYCWRKKSVTGQKSKGKKEIISLGRSFVAFCFLYDRFSY